MLSFKIFFFALTIRYVSGDFDEFDFVSGRPKAACIGCAGFATFSVLIEKFFDRHT